VREYAERMLDELEKHFGLNRYALPRSAKVLVRGRVLRYPRSKDRPKLRRGALVLHLAAKDVMEVDNEVMRAESARSLCCRRTSGPCRRYHPRTTKEEYSSVPL
jgi:hypothetical protein